MPILALDICHFGFHRLVYKKNLFISSYFMIDVTATLAVADSVVWPHGRSAAPQRWWNEEGCITGNTVDIWSRPPNHAVNDDALWSSCGKLDVSNSCLIDVTLSQLSDSTEQNTPQKISARFWRNVDLEFVKLAH